MQGSAPEAFVTFHLMKKKRGGTYALTYPKGGPYVFVDHNGNEFKSLAKMCNYYDIDRKVFRDRMNSGWSLKDALTMASESPIVEKNTLTT